MKIAIVGATGLVGREILKILQDKGLTKKNELFLYASKHSAGKLAKIGNKKYVVAELCVEKLEKQYDFAILAAGGEISKKFATEFEQRGAYVIDNSSAFRRDEDKALVVPEINFDEIYKNSKIIANPNCSTIGMSLPLYEIGRLYAIKRVVVSTYQAVSGAGKNGMEDLKNKTTTKFNHQIYNNLIPQIDRFLENGYTYEEDKMEFELKKILNNKNLKVSATCVRVPILNCHSESVYVELAQKPNINKIRNILENANGIKLLDCNKCNEYPMPVLCNKKDDVYVGRLRQDSSNAKAISFFVCFDNIRKGAALNAVQIMEKLIGKNK